MLPRVKGVVLLAHVGRLDANLDGAGLQPLLEQCRFKPGNQLAQFGSHCSIACDQHPFLFIDGSGLQMAGQSGGQERTDHRHACLGGREALMQALQWCAVIERLTQRQGVRHGLGHT